MFTASSVAGKSSAGTGHRLVAAMASRPLGIALAIVALLTAFRVTGTVDSDVAWQLWIAGRIHAGAHLYRDIIEVNPPLWFWMALPIDSIASAFHVRIESILAISDPRISSCLHISFFRVRSDLGVLCALCG